MGHGDKKKENERKKWDTYRLFDERNESVAFGLERLGIPHNAAVSAEMERNKNKQTHMKKLQEYTLQNTVVGEEEEKANTSRREGRQ